MTKKKRTLAPELDVLIRERLEGDEIVLNWSEYHPGEITVRLISAKLHHVCAPIAKRFGLGAGTGRMLEFKLEKGRWVFRGVGDWIS